MINVRAPASISSSQSEPYAGGNLDLSASSKDAESFTLVPRTQTSEAVSGDRWQTMLFRLDGAYGRAPTLILPYANSHAHSFAASTFESIVAPVWSYSYPAGESGWTLFDNYDRSNTDQLVFENASVWTQSTVYISLKRRKAISEYYDLLTNDYFQRSYVQPPVSGGVSGSAFQVATQPGATDADLGSAVSRDINDEPVYACVVEESSRNPDKTVLVICGQHPGEHNNKLAFEGFFEWITSEEAKAQNYRSHFTTICLPHTNPTGEQAGLWRGPAEDPTQDQNRSWGQTDQTTYQGTIETVMVDEVNDVGNGDVVVALDLHGAFSTDTGYIRGTGTDTTEQNYQSAVANYNPDMNYDAGSDDTGRFRWWSDEQWPGLASLTMERAAEGYDYSTERTQGEYYAKALDDRAEAGDYT